MRIAIMQPYFFPYFGYFQLIHVVDKFVLANEFQYITRGWINRNRIINYNKNDFVYIIAPLQKHSREAPIKDIKTVEKNDWKEKLLRQLLIYKNKAPYFQNTYQLVENCINSEKKNIAELNRIILEEICNYIGIRYHFISQSELGFKGCLKNSKEDKLISICKKLNADEYINPIGGLDLYDKSIFAKNNIELKFLKSADLFYDQKCKKHVSNLSIIDVLMFNSKEAVVGSLNNYELV